MKDNNGCDCKDCNPKKDYKMFILPSLIIITGMIQLSLSTLSLSAALIGVSIYYMFKKLKNMEEKIKNCECWY